MRAFMVGRSILLISFALSCLAAGEPAAAKESWRAVSPEDLAQGKPKVEEDADAEALFWDVRVEDALNGTQFMTDIWTEARVKVFTPHGVESMSRVQIPFDEHTQITDVAGRTVLPDGKIVELRKDDVFEQTLVKAHGHKVKVKTFVLPAVVPGAILDFRWRELRLDQLSINVRLLFQREIPIQRLVYRIKSLAIPWEADFEMKTTMYNGVSTPFDREPDGFYRTAMANVPAFHDEPDMPPEPQVKPWMLLWYGATASPGPERFWPDFGRKRYDLDRAYLKVARPLRDAAAQITGDATTADLKLDRLDDFCRTQIRNLSDDASPLTAEERLKLQDAKNPSETLEKKQGTGWDVNCLFGALAIAAGFDARIAWLGDRSDMVFDPRSVNPAFMSQACVAVRSGDQWRFFDPAVTYVPPGMLPWWLEGTTSLVPDERDPIFYNTASSPSSKSRCRRIASLKLAPNGDLSGDCRIEYTGHWGEEMKETYDDESAADREKALLGIVEGSIGSATVSRGTAENVTDPSKPFAWTFHLDVPGYAQSAGSRVFLQPGIFQHATKPRFTASRRRYPVQFDYMWSEDDSISIELPPGAALEGDEGPKKVSIGNFADLDATVIAADDRLVYHRAFHFDRLSFSSIDYPLLKEDFERVHELDERALALRLSQASK